MRYHHFFYLAACVVFGACATKNSGHGNDSGQVATVDVASSFDNPVQLSASQLGSKITFVPLETTDTSLISNNYLITVTDRNVVVSNFGSESNVLVFDRNSGRFLNHIGQFGGGPDDFRNPYHLIDSKGSRIFLRPASGSGLMAFTPDGKPSGKILETINMSFYPNTVISDSLAWLGGMKDANDDRGETLRMATMSGEVIDSVRIFGNQKLAAPFPNSFTVKTDYKYFIPILGDPLQSVAQVTNNGMTYVNFQPVIYRVGNRIKLRETLCDTIYNVTPDGWSHSIIFDMGKHRFPIEDLNTRTPSSSHLFVTDMAETESKLLFGLSEGWPMDDNHTEYIGIFDKASGTTSIGRASDAIKDDISGFISFIPSHTSTDGAFVGFISPEEVITWREEHPDSKLPAWVSRLKSDDNPVMVIVSE
ncbi:MAG: DUF4934 domain-containing protein [Paramuribaculum sp.]